MALFEAREVCKFYNQGTANEVCALQRVSLTVPRHSFCALSGPSGAGKTTLLSLLGALARPSGGQILFDGIDLAGCSDSQAARVRRQLGWVFQAPSLVPRLAVWENVTYPLVPRGVLRTERRRIAQAVLERLNLIDRLNAAVETLSGGEQQRVAVARALVGKPVALIADEPTSGLDPAAKRSLALLFAELHAAGTTVIVSSHDSEIVTHANLTFAIEAGRLKTTQ
jgi:putative ABC transport system ATP-binding protein